MNLKLFFRRSMLVSAAAAACMCIGACSSEDPESEPKPKPQNDGEVTFTIDLPEGIGSGSGSSPIEVQKGETLDVVIRQKSSYTDPNGSVYTCEPKADIKLFAKLDTVVVKDLQELTKVKDGAAVTTDKTGTSPEVNRTVQTFDVGGQNIVFDLTHEIYTYVSSAKEKIEMPYIKLNQAKLGNSGATETKAQGRSAAVITGVTVRPLAITRGPVLRDSTMYAVTVRFNLDLESVHAKEADRQTLEFSVNYVGVVETVTELPDPVAELSCRWEAKSGTGSAASPFVKTKGETPMEIWMAQSSTYTDEYGNKATAAPKAKIKLSVARDTVWTKTADELRQLAAKEGGSESGQAATQTFGSDLQDVEIQWSYESAEAVLADKTIAMPYCTLAPVTLKDVSSKKVSEKKTDTGKPVETYEVTATFSQKAAAKNTTAEMPEMEIEYVVSYVGIVGETIGAPSAALSYQWEVKSGTESTASPFVKTKGETPMEIWMTQSSTYADGFGGDKSAAPKAKIKLSVARDTVWTKTADELRQLAAKEGGSESGQAATQTFGSDLQDVEIQWSYESAEAVLADKQIPMPYYSLAPATLKKVSVEEVADDAEIDGKFASVYEVTATFSQKATAKNTTAEMPEVEIEYVVSYVGAVEITLAKVEYFPGGEWVDPHDNMVLAYYAKVERYRTYSNGKRVGPDVFYNYGHSARPYPACDYVLGKRDHGDGIWCIAYPYTRTNTGDSIVTQTASFQVSEMIGTRTKSASDGYTMDVPFKDWSGYRASKPVDASHNIAKDFDNPDYPRDDRPSGWYYQLFKYRHTYFVLWKATDSFSFPIINLGTVFDFYDQFLVIDGRRIDFSELHNLNMNFSHSQSAFSDSHKEGDIHKFEMRTSYLGKKFYYSQIDTIYVAK